MEKLIFISMLAIGISACASSTDNTTKGNGVPLGTPIVVASPTPQPMPTFVTPKPTVKRTPSTH